MDGFLKWAIWALPFGWLAWWLWWRLPKREVARMRHSIRSAKDRVEVEDTLRKTIGQALGAIAVLIGAGFALAQFLEQRDTAQHQIQVSQKQVEISQQQVQASHELLISNQIAKGFEQLGSDKVEVRLGGIYALEGILNMPLPDGTASPDYRQPVLEALCAFVREHTIGMIVAKTPTTDVQAVLTVIGRRRVEGVPAGDAEGSGSAASRLGQVNLSNANLEGADLNSATLIRANLEQAFLIRATLEHAILSLANLSEADLRDVKLSGATLFSATLINATLYDADLTRADLTHADLTGADLSGGDLRDVRGLSQAQLDMACGTDVRMPAGLTLNRPCLPRLAPAESQPHKR